MNPIQLVPSVATCKRLAESGVLIDSHFHWNQIILRSEDDWRIHNFKIAKPFETVPAPTASELLAFVTENKLFVRVNCFDGRFFVDFIKHFASGTTYRVEKDSFEEALSETLIWLKNNGHL